MRSLRDKIGQMIMAGCRGETLSRDERLVFAEYQFGGFILFGRNCAAPRQIVELSRDLWESAAETPPLLAIDQEGGRVHRLPPPFTHFPTAAALGARGDARLAYRAGEAVAVELALAGLNLNFAPVLDVDCNPSNPVIGDRAFAGDPDSVSELALAWSRGLRKGGVIPCGKHFPGHGGTDADSHAECPVVWKSWNELEKTELPPFIAACRAGIEAMMTAHVKFPALDPHRPATLSEPIVTGLLRQQLGYGGVVFSDDMDMKAVGDEYSAGDAAVLAVRAGVDVLLYCHDSDKAAQAVETLCRAAESEPALRAQIEASSARLAGLKEKFLKKFSGAAPEELDQRLGQLPHARLVAEIHGSL